MENAAGKFGLRFGFYCYSWEKRVKRATSLPRGGFIVGTVGREGDLLLLNLGSCFGGT